MKKRFRPSVEPVEPRALLTPVFIFNGNALAAAPANALTQGAAEQLAQHGDQPIQVSTPALNGPRVFYRIARYIRRAGQGRPIALMGFSAGGALAMRLASQPGLNVVAVMNYYGPPDLKDWLAHHRGDYPYRYVISHVRLTRGLVRLMSGPSSSTAYFVNAFGLHDRVVPSGPSAASFRADFQNGAVFNYPGPHGVSLFADYSAFRDFLNHLGTENVARRAPR